MNDNPFDYARAKAGEPVCTHDGRRVRIVCWDVKNENFPILALVLEKDGREHPYAYTENGRVVKGGVRLESDLEMYVKKPETKMHDQIRIIKIVFRDEPGTDYIDALRGKLRDALLSYTIDGRRLLVCIPFRKGPELFSYLTKLAKECFSAGGHEFRCVYMDRDETFGECGYYETCRGAILGTRFINRIKQERTIGEFFTEEDRRLCAYC